MAPAYSSRLCMSDAGPCTPPGGLPAAAFWLASLQSAACTMALSEDVLYERTPVRHGHVMVGCIVLSCNAYHWVRPHCQPNALDLVLTNEC